MGPQWGRERGRRPSLDGLSFVAGVVELAVCGNAVNDTKLGRTAHTLYDRVKHQEVDLMI